MTKIIKLEMKGFKSFAKHTDMLFGDDFNVILGPNGSGKSNVIDSLCFVLGKSSAKGLRAEKSANLIYNGGKSKTPMKQGEVSIYFDNANKDFPLDTKEVKLSRVVNQKGASAYYINGKRYTRSEVIDFLHTAKINPDGYNIILQGDIVRFVEMSGEQRRKMIEEIADISIYEEKKHKAHLELEKVEGSFKEAEIILKERNTYLRDLSKEKEQAKKYDEHETTVKRGKATIVTRQVEDKSAKVTSINSKNKDSVERQVKLQTEITDLKKAILDAKTQVKEINAEIERRGDAEQVAIHKEIEQLKIQIATDKSRVESINEELGKVSERKKQLKVSIGELGNRAKGMRQEEKDLGKEFNDTDKLSIDLKKKIVAFKAKNKLDGGNAVEEKIENLDVQIDTEQKKMDELRLEQQDLMRTKDRLEIQISTADEKIDKVLAVSKEHKKEIEQLKQKKVEFKKVTLELSQKLSTDSSLASQLGNSRGRSHFLQEELAKLSARRASIQETLGGSMASAKILENKSKIGGVHGTVSSLGSVKTKYSKALEVAAGGKIKGIVVDTDRNAQDAISFLKKNKLGVATFLPINKMRSPRPDPELKNILSKPGVLGRAVDLITFDAKYATIFNFVFGNTVVVQDIQTARAIGIGSAKMVTLEGDVVEKSGAMQGGFRKAQGGGVSFSQQEVDDKSKEFEEELSDIQSILSNLETQKANSEKSIDELREFKAHLEGDIIKLEKGLHLDNSDLDINQKLKGEFKQEFAAVDTKLTQVQMTVSSMTSGLAKLKIEKQQLRNEISELRNPAKMAELNTFEEQLTKQKERKIRIESDLKNIANQIKNLIGPEEERTQNIIKQQEKDEAQYKDQIAQIKGASQFANTRLKDLEEKEKKFYAQFKKSFDLRKKLTEEIEQLEAKQIKKEESIRDTERRLSVVNIEVAKLEAELSVLREELAEYKDVEVYKTISTEDIRKKIYSAERQLASIGPVNMKAVQMYDKVKEEYDKLMAKKETLISERENVLVMINQIESRKKDLFIKVFDRLNANFKRIFASISEKGEAYLELENPEQPFEGGVNVKVKLSSKKFMDIRSLSGGEKTMTALAFIFAIQENDPSSFYIMDEVDAALDKRNAERLAELIRQYCDRAQYIVISHNDGVISAANTLYGVSMDQQSGISKIVSLKL